MQNFQPEGSLWGTPENNRSLSSYHGLLQAMENAMILEGIVTLCDKNLCLHVDFPCGEGIIEPQDALLCRPDEIRKDIAILSRVGKPVAFRVLSVEKQNGKVLAKLSRKAAQEDCFNSYLLGLIPGDILPAKVTHLESFGAFLDIGCGIPSLLSVDCISISRISHPRDRLKVGDSVPVVLKRMDADSRRLDVSMRELLGTWEENAALFHVGQTVTGIIRSVESYGIFIELSPNLAGLAELKNPEEIEEIRAMVGKSVAVYIKSMIPERMKVKLVIIDVLSSPSTRRSPCFFLQPETTHHISRWLYSPPYCNKKIESVFQ